MSWEVGSDLVSDLRGEAGPRVIHCEDDAERAEGRVEHLPHELQSAPELAQPIERVVLTLDRYKNAIGRRQRVYGEKAERRRAVHEDVVECVLCAIQRRLESSLACEHADEFDLGTGQVDVRRRYRQVLHGRIHSHREKRRSVLEAVVHGAGECGLVHTQATRGVALRIHIHKEYSPAQRGQTGCEVDRGRRLAHPALLVDHGDRLAQSHVPPAAPHSRAARGLCQAEWPFSA
jgi:hypothetical protein